jgi:hypothetical protein
MAMLTNLLQALGTPAKLVRCGIDILGEPSDAVAVAIAIVSFAILAACTFVYLTR